MRDVCDSGGFVPEDRSLNQVYNGGIYFSIDRVNGSVPDFGAAGPCAEPLAAFKIEKEVQLLYSRKPNDTCTVLSKGLQQPVACAFQVDEEVGRKVEEKMLNLTRCGGNWPNETIVQRCATNGAGGYEGLAMISMIIAIIAAFLI